MKHMTQKKFSLIFCTFLLALLFPISIQAESNEYYDYSNGYVITDYNIHINVNENNTFDVSETITADFSIYKHGIFRTIPLNNTVKRENGKTTKNRAKITNLYVNHPYTTSRANGNYKIQIGDPNTTVTGVQTYQINYTYNIGEDPLEHVDEFYYNLIGPEWDTVIDNISFTITMPKDFDDEKLGFTSGYIGSGNTNNVSYSIDGNTISGYYTSYLSPGEAFTIRLELPEGYFVNAGIPIDKNIYLMFLIPVICALISFFLWFRFGKDDKTVSTVEFYPPEDYNSLEIGFLYKGKATNEDVVSLLIYLANKGYIEIVDMEERALFSTSKSFKIVKLKDYDGDNYYERIFLEGLFASRIENKLNVHIIDKHGIRPFEVEEDFSDNSVTEVTASQLKNHFYITMKEILSNINGKEYRHHIFEKSTFAKSVAVFIMIILSLVTIVAVPTLAYSDLAQVGMTLGITLFYVPFFAVGFAKNMQLLMRIFWCSFTSIHFLVFFTTMPIIDAFRYESIYLIGFVCGLVCIAIMVLCFKLMPKRTPYGIKILGQIEGFKIFLETTQADRLEALLQENPSYFYDILPYTYVLGISDKWISKFVFLAVEPPTWYRSPNSFSVSSFGAIMNSTMESATKAMGTGSSSGSSGSSGGGSSGGGSGGGGGGSW